MSYKTEKIEIERIQYNDYIIELETIDDAWHTGYHIFEFWLYKAKTGIKSYICGLPEYQLQAKIPEIVSKANAIEIVMASIDDDIKLYSQDLETLESAT